MAPKTFSEMYAAERKTSVAGVAIGLVIVGLLLFGWVWLVTAIVNYVLAAFGVAPVGLLIVWCCMFLLGLVGRSFSGSKAQ